MNPAALTLLVVLTISVNLSVSKDASKETVSVHGQLSVKGTNLVNKHGKNVQLKGMSLYWSQWAYQYWNAVSIKRIHENCYSNIVRAPMGVGYAIGGYLKDKSQMKLVETVVEAAIANDIYVLIDWHEEDADTHQAEAVEFFDQISKKYGKYPNILYEIFNEPTSQSWHNQMKPYHEAVIKAIRANDPHNVIVVGTPTWSSAVDQAADDPIKGQTNIMYTFHFYSGNSKQPMRDKAQAALNKGLPIFVTEYGTNDIQHGDMVDAAESALWWQWLDKNNISYCNWAIVDIDQGSAVIYQTPADKVCHPDYLTKSGKLVVPQNKK